MTDNAIVQWDPNSGAALPAYLSDALGGMGSNIQDRMTVPSLAIDGKVWALKKDGNVTKLQSKNQDGDMVPIPVMRMVVLNYNPDRGRAYYPGNYNPSQTAQPDCWSADGKTPDASAKNKQATQCNGCPMAVKGSKVYEGKEMVACGSHRMVAVAPPDGLAEDPFRLKLPVTSDYDKEVVEHGWFAFRQYTDFLKSRGISHTALVVTKAKFDPNVTYPKVLFSIDRLLTPTEVAQVQKALANPKVAELLAETWSAAGTEGTQTNDADIRPYGLEGAYADGWVSHPDAAGYSYKGQEVVANDELAARYPAPPPVEEPKQEAAPPPPAAPAEPPAGTPLTPIELAEQDGWIRHPETAGYHYKGQVVEATDKVAAMYATVPEAAPAAPPAPPAPEPEPVAHDPHAAALADGWAQHPESEPHGYKGQEVLDWATIHAKYPPASAATGAGGNGAATSAPAAPAGDGSGQTAQTNASPSSPAPNGSAEIPADVQDLLSKWA